MLQYRLPARDARADTASQFLRAIVHKHRTRGHRSGHHKVWLHAMCDCTDLVLSACWQQGASERTAATGATDAAAAAEAAALAGTPVRKPDVRFFVRH
jgi:hypothetical protein